MGAKRTKRKIEKPNNYRDENGVRHPIGWVRETPEVKSERISKSFLEWHKHNEHPKGMLGKKHTKKYCKEISQRVKKYWEEMTPEKLEKWRTKQVMTKINNGTLNPTQNCSNPYSRTKSGKRKDLNNVFFRSAWEANMARYYNFVGIKWEFEPKEFIFPDIKRGCVSYTPDFYLPEEDRWVEVKGWMDNKSKTKLRRFAKYFPEENKKLEIIQKDEYKAFSKYSRLIENWED